jgi:hypothetical protein
MSAAVRSAATRMNALVRARCPAPEAARLFSDLLGDREVLSALARIADDVPSGKDEEDLGVALRAYRIFARKDAENAPSHVALHRFVQIVPDHPGMVLLRALTLHRPEAWCLHAISATALGFAHNEYAQNPPVAFALAKLADEIQPDIDRLEREAIAALAGGAGARQ